MGFSNAQCQGSALVLSFADWLAASDGRVYMIRMLPRVGAELCAA